MECPFTRSDWDVLSGACEYCKKPKMNHPVKDIKDKCRLTKTHFGNNLAGNCPFCATPKESHRAKTLAALEEENAELRARDFRLKAYAGDDRVKEFSQESASDKTPPFPPSSYWMTCLCCGTKNGVTRAHILSNNAQTRETMARFFGTKSGFRSNVTGQSPRNHIPLCGTLGQDGSCHHAFDHGKLTLLYDPLTRKYYFYSKENTSMNRPARSTPTADNRPFRRLLVWRARHDALKTYDNDLLTRAGLVEGAAVSDAGEVAGPSSASPHMTRKRTHEQMESDSSWDLAAKEEVEAKHMPTLDMLIRDRGLTLQDAVAVLNVVKSDPSIDLAANFGVQQLNRRARARPALLSKFPVSDWEEISLPFNNVAFRNKNTGQTVFILKGG